MTTLRNIFLAVALSVGIALMGTSTAGAAQIEPTPLPNRLYVGDIFYRFPYTMTIRTSQDGKRLKVAPGYFIRMTKCGALGGDMYSAHIPSKQWLRIRSNKTFSGRGRGRVRFSSGAVGKFSWRVSGRFTTPRNAAGRITIKGVWSGSGTTLTCSPMTARWRTGRVVLRSDGLDF
jgi:hypothetical protein